MRPLDFLGRIKVKLGIVIVLAVGTAFVVNEVGLNSGLSREVRIAVAVVLALIMVQLLAMGMTKPLRQMASAAQTIAKGRYGLRVRATSRDEVGELARAFNAMAADLGEVDRQRRELVANVSHELRTPITGLRAVLENVVDGVSAPDPVTMRTALAQTERLGRLVAQLLDLSRLDSGVRLIEPEAIELAPLIEQAVREASLAREDVVIRPSAPADLVVRADPDLIAQVLANLLDNAVRHSPPDGTVHVHAVPSGAGVRLTVADQGPGIPLAARARVFERFSRLDTGRAADSGGAGLGLAIVKEIVELHGGSIRIDEGAGCRMVVDLPGRTRMADVPLQGEPSAGAAGSAAHDAGDEPLLEPGAPVAGVSVTDAPVMGVPVASVPVTGAVADEGAPAPAHATGLKDAGREEAAGREAEAGLDAAAGPQAVGGAAARPEAAAADVAGTGVAGPDRAGPDMAGSDRAGVDVAAADVAGRETAAGLAALTALATAGAPGGVASNGVASSGVAPDGVVPNGVASGGVASDGAASNGVASNGVAAGGAASRGDAIAASGASADELDATIASATEVEEAVRTAASRSDEPAVGAGAAGRGGAAVGAAAFHEGEQAVGAAAAQRMRNAGSAPPASSGLLRMVGGGVIGVLVGFLAGLFAAVIVSVTVGDGLALITLVTSIAFMGAVGAGMGAGSARRAAAAAYTSAQVAYPSAHATHPPAHVTRASGSAAHPPAQAAHASGSAAHPPAQTTHASGGSAQPSTQTTDWSGSAARQPTQATPSSAQAATLPGRTPYPRWEVAHPSVPAARASAQGPATQREGAVPPPPYVPPPLFPRPELPDSPRWLLPAAAGAGVFAAVALPDAQVGLGIVLVSMVLGAAALPAVIRRMTPWTVAFGLTAYFLISMAAVRDADWLVALLLVAGAGLGALAVSGAGAGWLGVIRGGMSVLLALGPVPWFLAEPFKRLSSRRRFMPALAALGITAVLLLVFGLLFASADAVFASFVERLTTAPDWADSAPLRIFLFAVFAVFLAAVVLVALRPVVDPVGPDTKFGVSRSVWLLPLTAVNLLFASFVAVQITALFGGNAWVLRTAGLTYAEYARQGFFQLVVVSVFVLGIVAVASGLLKVERRERLLLGVLLGVLCALTMVVLASALHRMNLYTDAYGLSRLRLSVQATVWWLGALFALVLLAGTVRLLGRGSGWLPRTVVLVTGLGLGAFAVVNPDLQVAQSQVEIRGVTNLDSDYLGDLGAEAVPALDRLPEPQRSCVLADVIAANELASPDPWNGWNLDRARARALLAEHPVVRSPQCPPGYSRGSG
ncbi:DUF4153 domain-containing protein [Nonomuraea phyllanthi]|nr:DUF4153 domain-containing protein [Nonomuraea phyllanthi]